MTGFEIGSEPVCFHPEGYRDAQASRPVAILPGSFHPLHEGHRTLAAVAGRILGGPVHFELSTANVDKPDLPAVEVQKRVAQFAGLAPLWVTRAPRFFEKAILFPQTVFVVGHDTAVRLIDPRYYSGESSRDAALERIMDLGCRVLVGGRVDATGAFRVWGEMSEALPARFGELFVVLPESEFRVDVSSTELRQRN